jgi:sugar/nucleoside kinase (ribokinase family)
MSTMPDRIRSRWRRERTPLCLDGDIDSNAGRWTGARCVLLQLEIPIETVAEGLREARRAGATCILDPAPARTLPKEILQLVDIATPNENEACVLAGVAAQPGECPPMQSRSEIRSGNSACAPSS